MFATPAHAQRKTRLDSSHFPVVKTWVSERWEHLASHEPIAIRAGAKSVTGLYRKRNEDRCAADAEHGVFLVADGVGGHVGGAEASETLTRVLTQWLAGTAKCAWQDIDIIESAMADAVEAARTEMIQLADNNLELRRMGATLALAVVVDRTLCVTHVGDCRAYLLHDGGLRRLTKDQTFVQAAIDAGLLNEETAHAHPWRHVITNVIGVKPLDEPIEVDEFRLSPGDRLLLCSDGLTDVVSDQRLQELLTEYDDVNDAADALIHEALDSDSKDNVTCVVVDAYNVETSDVSCVDLPELLIA